MGKSYTLGVLAEELGDAPGVAPIIADPMGVFSGLREVGGTVLSPTIRPAALPPAAWPDLLGLDPAGGPGSLLWRVVADARDATPAEASGSSLSSSSPSRSPSFSSSNSPSRSHSLDDFRDRVTASDATRETRRAARNHLDAAAAWGVFDATAPPVARLPSRADGDPVVIDLAGVPDAAAGAVLRAIASGLYDARVADRDPADSNGDRLPWLLVDEAHAFFGGSADPALRTVLTRGRAPGISLVCATQRPEALPAVAVSQADLLIAHRLTAERDVDALAAAEATYLAGGLAERLPTGIGEALVVDDATEAAHRVRVRERRTTHGGESPRASDLVETEAETTNGTDN